MKRKALLFVLVMALCVGTASAQFGVGIVYDPTNYSNALLRYYQLQQHLLQLRASYAQLVAQYNFAVRMAKNIQNMPARYRAQFSQWRNTSASNTYGNTGTWVNGINSGQTGFVSTGYQQSTTLLLARFTSCVLQSGVDLPYRAIKTNIADSLNVVVHVERRPGRRYISEVLFINRYDPDADLFDYGAVFLAKQDHQ